MKITYTNARGEVVFYGGGREGFRITSVSGLDMPERDRALANYAGQDGVTVRSAQYGQRIITVCGDFLDTDRHKTAVSKAIHIFSAGGTLKIEGPEKVRVIAADSASFALGEKKGDYQIFCAQFTCDFPNFTDGQPENQGIYGRVNYIRHDKALPYVFTERMGNQVTVLNGGNINAEPVICFEGINPVSSAEGELRVENKTTGKQLRIAYALEDGETLCLDVPKRVLTSSVHGDVTGSILPDSFFSDIYLIPGENKLAVTGGGANVNMSGSVQYTALYVEAVV